MGRIAEIALHLPVDKTFHYEVPDDMADHLRVGCRVRVPFRNRRVEGFCVGFADKPEIPWVRSIDALLNENPLIDERLLELARWISLRYCSSWGEAIFATIPPGARKKNPGKKVALIHRVSPPPAAPPLRSDNQKAILQLMESSDGPLLQSELTRRFPRSALDGLIRRGLLRRELVTPKIDLLSDVVTESHDPVTLTDEQEKALAGILEGPGTVLLHGITGSGKTEVYLRAIEEMVRRDRQSIVLVPEISLTPQTVGRFRARFPRTAVLHSLLTESERGAQWQAARRGEVDVVIGARSAIFAPVARLGLIVVDEEHEPAYKQENTPRYHVRDVARRRAETEKGIVVLGSATPSLESFFEVRQGNFRLARLTRRIGVDHLPPVEIISMAQEVSEVKRMTLFSRRLRQAVEEAAARKEQSLLFLNRRGYCTWITCKKCGWVLRCNRCDIALTFHKEGARAECHTCARTAPLPDTCPDCLVGTPRHLGSGTEKVEEEVQTLFPDRTIARMDRDAMKTRKDYRQALGGLWSGSTDILVGTQMIAKGFDVPNVTVVGVISADTAFHLPDFRAAERTFQLITQVAGRAGRGPGGGKVIVQSWNPDHYSLQLAASYDTEKFVEKELEMREELGYPPFTRLVRILFQGTREETIRESASRFAGKFREKVDPLFASLLGPAPAPIHRIKNRIRMHCLVKTKEMDPVLEALRDMMPSLSRNRAVQTAVDVDPVSML